jgi:hypothetical protein
MKVDETIDARVAEYRHLLERRSKLIEEGRKQTSIIFNPYCDEYFAFKALGKCQQI